MNPLTIIAISAAALGVVYALFRKTSESTTKKVSSYNKIYVVGDSIAQGMAQQIPDEQRGVAVTHVGAVMPVVQNEVYAHWKDGTGPLEGDLVLVNVGTNDSYSTQLTPAQIQMRVHDFMDMLSVVASGVDVLWALPPAAATNSKYDALRLALLQEEVPTIEMESGVDYLAADGIHMAPAGYAEYVRQVLAS